MMLCTDAGMQKHIGRVHIVHVPQAGANVFPQFVLITASCHTLHAVQQAHFTQAFATSILHACKHATQVAVQSWTALSGPSEPTALASAHAIITMHGGTCTAHRDRSGLTTLQFTLPMHTPKPRRRHALKTNSQQARHAPRSVSPPGAVRRISLAAAAKPQRGSKNAAWQRSALQLQRQDSLRGSSIEGSVSGSLQRSEPSGPASTFSSRCCARPDLPLEFCVQTCMCAGRDAIGTVCCVCMNADTLCMLVALQSRLTDARLEASCRVTGYRCVQARARGLWQRQFGPHCLCFTGCALDWHRRSLLARSVRSVRGSSRPADSRWRRSGAGRVSCSHAVAASAPQRAR